MLPLLATVAGFLADNIGVIAAAFTSWLIVMKVVPARL